MVPLRTASKKPQRGAGRGRSWLRPRVFAAGSAVTRPRLSARPATVLTGGYDTISGMSRLPTGRAEDERRLFVADPDALDELGLTIDQLADPDVRSAVIRCEHPDFTEALQDGRWEVELGDGPMNPRLHLAMHEVVATSCGTTRRPKFGTPGATARSWG